MTQHPHDMGSGAAGSDQVPTDVANSQSAEEPPPLAATVEAEALAEVEALLAATANLSARAEPEAVLRALVELAGSLLEADRAVYAVRRDDRIIIPADWEHGSWIEAERDAVLTGIVRLVWQSGHVYRSNEVAEDPNLNDVHVARLGLRSQLAAPLLSPSGEPLGIISLDNSRRPGGFSPRDERLLVAICETGAAVLVRANEAAARLAAERAAARSQREVEALLAAADQLNSAVDPEEVLLRVVSIAVELLGVERGGVVTDEGDVLILRQTWVRGSRRPMGRQLPRDSSLAGLVIRERRSYRIEQLDEAPFSFVSISSEKVPNSALAVPIIAPDGRALGALQLFDRRDGRPFSEADQRLAEGIAHHAAIALERAAYTAALLGSERRFSALLQHVSDVIAIIDAKGIIRYESPSLQRIAGYLPEELVGHDGTECMHPDDVDRLRNYFVQAAARPGLHEAVQFRFRHRDGHWMHVESVANNLLDDPSVQGVVMTSRDITEHTELEQHLRHLAVTDSLTGLSNRSLFFDRLVHALDLRRRRGPGLAVLFLDLDGFKTVNDTLGHAAGDELLQEIGQRLRLCLRTADTLARFGGDEFAILLEDVIDRAGAGAMADRVLTRFGLPFSSLRGHALPVTASIGVTFHAAPIERLSADDLIREADGAMYRAKAHGKACAVMHTPEADARPPQAADRS